MLARLKNWLNGKSSSGEATSADRLKKTGTYDGARPVKNTEPKMKIVDDSLVDPEEDTGIDPYNTGGFDRSKNWKNSFLK